uniref:RNase H type-1 domain-containing protein n=1 Tax=Anopheles quadriannulatus TaxID=34691 RepID=A0A182XPH5_ANOQN
MLLDQTNVQIHSLADADEVAYGACVYLTNREGILSLPRLELCAAVLGAKLWKTACISLKQPITESYFMSDSTIVLNWLRAPSYTWATFVANRVATIQDLTQGNHWQHVKGSENPADILSRGALPNQLTKEWLQGPHWLSNDECTW